MYMEYVWIFPIFKFYLSSALILFAKESQKWSHEATPNHCVKLRRLLSSHNLWNCYEFFRNTLYVYHMWRVMWPQGKNSSEPISEFDEVVYVHHMHTFLYRAYYVCVLGKFVKTCRDQKRALFGEIRRSDFHIIRHRWHYTIALISEAPWHFQL